MTISSVTNEDIIIAIRPQHVANIAKRVKDHEFRKYLIPATVRRMWVYETSPASSITYVATISSGKRPGELDNEVGLRNKEFNDGKIEHLARYAYQILELKQLQTSITLQELVSNGWLGGPPQKYCYIKQVMAEALRQRPLETIFITTPRVAKTLQQSTLSFAQPSSTRLSCEPDSTHHRRGCTKPNGIRKTTKRATTPNKTAGRLSKRRRSIEELSRQSS